MIQQFHFWVIPKRFENRVQNRYCKHMFIAALLTIAKVYKQHECMSTYESINERQYIYMMEFYSALKRNEVVIHAMTRMNWKQYMLSERTQTYKATYVRFHLHKTSRIGTSTKTKSKLVVSRV